MRMAKLGVLLDRQEAERRWSYGLNVFEFYLTELLEQAGIPYQLLSDTRQLVADQDRFDIVLAGLARDDEESVGQLLEYARAGGALIALGGLHAAALQLGCKRLAAEGAGYAKPGRLHESNAVRYLLASPWEIVEPNAQILERVGTLHRDSPDRAPLGDMLQRFAIGEGWVDRFAVHIPETVVRLQQGGSPVLDDGVPAPDGSAAINDHLLKADDRMEMDWVHDRSFSETGSPYFAHPYADYWRDILIGRILKAAVEKGLTLPFIAVWPESIGQVAVISHDSDKNLDEHAEATLKLLEECGIRSTWCIIEPGYSAPIYEKVKQAGHELALHYNALALDKGFWAEEEFVRQLDWFKKAANLDTVPSNKNHFTRYEGWGDLFAWCEKYGIASDQTRGPSKRGNVGFLFGTCHPYHPIAWANERNRLYDVMEVGFLTQDLADSNPYWPDPSVIAPLLEKVKQVEGIAHFLVHQVHICTKDEVRQSMRAIVNQARSLGFTFWTVQQVNDWQRSRRKLRIISLDDNGMVAIEGSEQLTDTAVVWLPQAEAGEGTELRYGIPCRKQLYIIQKL